MINAGFANNCGIELFNIGWVQCPSDAVPAPAPSHGGGRGTGGIHRPRTGYERGRDDAVEETRRKRILQEDDDIIALLTAMLNNGLL